MKFNKKTTAIICATVGTCTVATAALASYRTSNGYDALKKGILATQDLKNGTISLGYIISVDGVQTATDSLYSQFDFDNQITHTKIYNTETYSYDNKLYTNSDDNGWSYYSFDKDSLPSTDEFWFNNLNEDSKIETQKVTRFLELTADTVVGDLKNNFVCTEDNDDYTAYSITLDSVQIPELVNAGVSLIANFNSQEYPLGDDASVDKIDLKCSIGKDGIIRDLDSNIDVVGNGHTVSINITGDIIEIGTTIIEKLEDQGITATEDTNLNNTISYNLEV